MNGRPVHAHRLPHANEASIAPARPEELVEVKLVFALTEKPKCLDWLVKYTTSLQSPPRPQSSSFLCLYPKIWVE